MRRLLTLAAAMAVLFVSGYGEPRAPGAVRAGPTGPDVLEVTCAPGATTVSADRVVAAADGVHIRVRNPAGTPHVVLNAGSDRGFGGGDAAPAGISDRVLGLAPGAAWLECGYDDNRRLSGRAPVTVLDPATHWRSGAVVRAAGRPRRT